MLECIREFPERPKQCAEILKEINHCDKSCTLFTSEQCPWGPLT